MKVIAQRMHVLNAWRVLRDMALAAKTRRFYAQNGYYIAQAKKLFVEVRSRQIFEAFLRLHSHYSNKLHEISEMKEETSIQTGIICHYKKDFEFISDKNQYFPNFICLNDNEVFWDVGAYTGDTIDAFIEQSGQKFKEIVAFEPNGANYRACLERISTYSEKVQKRISMHHCGLSNEEGEAYFSAEVSISGGTGTGKEKCAIRRIENILSPEELYNVSYIKMDVEGGELPILHSLQNVIEKCYPKLAISIYHKPEDIWTIPLFLKQIQPRYAFYLRHHSNWIYDTVLYAVYDEEVGEIR